MSIQQTVKAGVAFLEQTINDLTAERDYLDARCAELEVEIIKLRVKLSEKEMK